MGRCDAIPSERRASFFMEVPIVPALASVPVEALVPSSGSVAPPPRPPLPGQVVWGSARPGGGGLTHGPSALRATAPHLWVDAAEGLLCRGRCDARAAARLLFGPNYGPQPDPAEGNDLAEAAADAAASSSAGRGGEVVANGQGAAPRSSWRRSRAGAER
jgi:hypothetical protein